MAVVPDAGRRGEGDLEEGTTAPSSPSFHLMGGLGPAEGGGALWRPKDIENAQKA